MFIAIKCFNHVRLGIQKYLEDIFYSADLDKDQRIEFFEVI